MMLDIIILPSKLYYIGFLRFNVSHLTSGSRWEDATGSSGNVFEIVLKKKVLDRSCQRSCVHCKTIPT